MKIYFRIASKQKTNIQMVKNTIFVSKNPVTFVVYPVPSFLENPKCGCGNNAEYILDDMTCICNDCINKSFKGSQLRKVDDVSVPLTEHTIKRIKFEWSVNGDRWYTVYGRSLKPENWKTFLNVLGRMILHNKEITLDVDYCKESKEMIIY